MSSRPRSYAFAGGAFGDEGKGRIVDEFVARAAQQGKVVVYRDNGGANAGHTVEFANGQRVALHQLPSGMFSAKAIVVLGKGMVIHPGDLLMELEQVQAAAGDELQVNLYIDESATLSLDTHRAFEAVLKDWQSGSKGSTGRGIAPAYADVLLRHPLKMRDIAPFDKDKVAAHYQLYKALVKGLGQKLAEVAVPSLSGDTQLVGTKTEFIKRLRQQARLLKKYVKDVYPVLEKRWQDPKTTFVFEKAQAIGLDSRWGVYPDVTASDTTYEGIFSSTEGLINPQAVAVRAAVIKATYMSSVGTRQLPSMMEEQLAHRIREDAHEYGATTKRPRDITYLDLPALRFFFKVGRVTHAVLTHMDIAYPEVPMKVCVGYERQGQAMPYRPDQTYLDELSPVFEELPSWDGAALQAVTEPQALPSAVQQFITFIEDQLAVPVLMMTTGPRRDQSLMFQVQSRR